MRNDVTYIPPQKQRYTETRKSVPGGLAALLMALLYGVSPIDLIPDLIPLLGWSDDAAVWLVLGSVAYKLLKKRKVRTQA